MSSPLCFPPFANFLTMSLSLHFYANGHQIINLLKEDECNEIRKRVQLIFFFFFGIYSHLV
jgi:hypothetical protein